MNLRTRARFGLATAALALLLVACGQGGKGGSGTPPPPTNRGLSAEGDGGLAASTAIHTEYSENDFTENDRNRDPFRSYATIFVETTKRVTTNQRQIMLGEYSIDELKLVAIVTGGESPRAMLVDPNGKGWVVKRGDFLGRPDIVHTGGTNGTDYQLNWRVDRVRDGDLVLIREDPAQPGIPPATRVVTLHPESELREREKLEQN